MKKYIVILTPEERAGLSNLICIGQTGVRKVSRARILLKADQGLEGPGWSDEQISQALEVGKSTVERTRRRFVTEGLPAALNRRPNSNPRGFKVDGQQEAHLIALACSQPPPGRKRWTYRLLADKMVELEYIDDISHETVRQVLKKRHQALA